MIAHARSLKMLRTAFGPALTAALCDPDVVEIMLNPDGRIWLDRLAKGLEPTPHRLEPAEGERIVRLVAHHVGLEVDETRPRLSAELPGTGERFEGLLPPIVRAPAFAIRKPAVAVFTLDDYVASGIMREDEARTLRAAVAGRRNILVVGGTSSGKTTLVNALLAEMADSGDRIILIEDTRELQCAAPNTLALRTKEGAASLTDLVRSALRLRPDRIPIGEVRGAEALDLVKACLTRLFLPNARAREPQIAAVYRRFGLNARQIDILAQATPKRDYYCQSPAGDRLFELGLGPVALAFCAASSATDQAAIRTLLEDVGPDGFSAAWLRHRGLPWAADLLPIVSSPSSGEAL